MSSMETTPLTTACAIDRLIHYSTILELTGTSYRKDAAKHRKRSQKRVSSS